VHVGCLLNSIIHDVNNPYLDYDSRTIGGDIREKLAGNRTLPLEDKFSTDTSTST